MDTIVIVGIVAATAALVLLLAAGWLVLRKKHTNELQDQFGREYEYELDRRGSRSEAEQELDARRERVAKLDIRALSLGEHTAFSGRWKDAQARFVDDPSRAVVEADLLCREVMETRGYPMGDFEQRAADISVDHPDVVTNYRAAHQIAIANADDKATTEELRRAMKHYRSLFDDLLEVDPAEAESAERDHAHV
jgi:hypothetical protein